MLKKLLKLVSTGVLLSLMAQIVCANLLINPTRVQFNPDDRTADITLINTSKVTTTYRMQWVEKKAKAGGGYYNLASAGADGFPSASNMLRLSPKQVTLKAGERQTIKLAIRRPQGLATGEYRSHLLFKALPPTTAEEGLNTDGVSTTINVVLSFSIPVVVQQGTLQYNLTMNDAEIHYDSAQKTGSVELSLSRTGLHSVIGNVSAYWTPAGGTERLIAKAGDFNAWPELSATSVSLIWVGADFAPSDGKLRIIYEGVKDFRGKVFFEKTLNVTRSMIKTAS
jgi:P pilus assembly chaperone PapD